MLNRINKIAKHGLKVKSITIALFCNFRRLLYLRKYSKRQKPTGRKTGLTSTLLVIQIGVVGFSVRVFLGLVLPLPKKPKFNRRFHFVLVTLVFLFPVKNQKPKPPRFRLNRRWNDCCKRTKPEKLNRRFRFGFVNRRHWSRSPFIN